jgi:hypothetical protein
LERLDTAEEQNADILLNGASGSSLPSSGSLRYSSSGSVQSKQLLQIDRSILAAQALAEPDEDDDLLSSRSTMNMFSSDWSMQGAGSSASLGHVAGESPGQLGRNKELESNLQILASAALVGRSLVMAETDTPWTWSSLLTDVSTAMKSPK